MTFLMCPPSVTSPGLWSWPQLLAGGPPGLVWEFSGADKWPEGGASLESELSTALYEVMAEGKAVPTAKVH